MFLHCVEKIDEDYVCSLCQFLFFVNVCYLKEVMGQP